MPVQEFDDDGLGCYRGIVYNAPIALVMWVAIILTGVYFFHG